MTTGPNRRPSDGPNGVLDPGYGQAAAVALLFLAFALSTSLPWIREPRFYAEEAQLFIAGLHDGSLWDSLTFQHRRGYYQLPINLSAFLATRFEMPLWPAVTEIVSLVVQTLVVLSPFIFMSRRHPARRSRLPLALSFAFLLPNAETWLNITCMHFLLAVPGLLVLTDSCCGATRRRTAWTTLYLAFACLSGPPACLLAPALMLRWTFCRSRAALVQALTVGGLAALQVFLMHSAHPPGGPASIVEPAAALEALVVGTPSVWLAQSVVLPIAGFGAFAAAGKAMVAHPWVAVALVAALWVVRRDADRLRGVALLGVFVATYLAGVLVQQEVAAVRMLQQPVVGERYTSVASHASALLLFMLLSHHVPSPWHRLLRAAAVLAIVVAGGAYGVAGRKQFPGPVWSHELAAERAGARPCGLIIPGPEVWIVQLDRERLRREIASRLVTNGFLAASDETRPAAIDRAIRRYKAEALQRPDPNAEIGDGMVERLCGYTAILAPYRVN